MKHLAMTFAIALGLIGTAVTFNGSDNGNASTTIAKTVINEDTIAQTTSEVTWELHENDWVESRKTITQHISNGLIKIHYIKNGKNWQHTAKEVYRTSGSSAMLSKTSYTAATNGTWTLDRDETFTDLSFDDGTLCDMVFDKEGNLIMSATYAFDNSEKNNGITKTEFEYNENGQCSRTIAYAWNNDSWSASRINDNYYIMK